MSEIFKTHVDGHVRITDDLGNVLVDKHNAIHPRNMAVAIARGLSNTPNYQIFKLKLGNQGTYIDASQQIVFRPPNTTGDNADLYNPTYVEVVDDADAAVGSGNSVTFTAVPGTVNTRVIVTCVISANEAVNRITDTADSATPSADPAIAGTVDPEGEFFFDELGLFTKQTSGTLLDGPGELMLSHLIFSPIEHTGSRELTMVYTLTVSVS
ncbi:hypothetical protein [Janthinobacterium sp.]|uniref:hypothetical protein n=1 Tax=Janthinobacterium sp. TaxID=1871054 RepID=UPI0026018054|nr:hypothetical protein [Janthinobacterium sp.]